MGVLDLFRRDGQVALVTGCSRGIGEAMAVALTEAGADVAGVSRSLAEKGSEVELDVIALGRRFLGYSCDLADPAVYGFIEKVWTDLPAIDILVNNAGHHPTATSGRAYGQILG